MKMMTVKVLASILFVFSNATHAQVAPEISYESVSKSLPCVSRIGRCFDATIAGIKVTAIQEKAKQEQMFRDAKAKNKNVRTFYWELSQEVGGDKVLDIVTQSNAYGLAHVGDEDADPEIMVTPLQEQALASSQSIAPANGVNIGGKAVLTQQNTLDQAFLPPGEYIITIRYNGTANWDRKMVYVKVKADTNSATRPLAKEVALEANANAVNEIGNPVIPVMMQPGGWEIRSTVTATDAETSATKTMIDGVIAKFCYTQGFLDKHPFLTPGIDKEKMEQKNALCKISNEQRSSNAASWHMSCQMQDKSHVFAMISNTVSATSYQVSMITAVSSNSKPPILKMLVAGTFIGACTAEMLVQ